jgi:hypothetical protein
MIAGFMAMTAFLSMWLNNSATTSLMVRTIVPLRCWKVATVLNSTFGRPVQVPIALAILHQIKEATGESTQLLERYTTHHQFIFDDLNDSLR